MTNSNPLNLAYEGLLSADKANYPGHLKYWFYLKKYPYMETN